MQTSAGMRSQIRAVGSHETTYYRAAIVLRLHVSTSEIPSHPVLLSVMKRRAKLLSYNLIALLSPGVVLLISLLVLPLANILVESFRQYVPGMVGGSLNAPFTFANYVTLLHPVYINYLTTMLWCASIATLAALVMSYPIAYAIARTKSRTIRIA